MATHAEVLRIIQVGKFEKGEPLRNAFAASRFHAVDDPGGGELTPRLVRRRSLVGQFAPALMSHESLLFRSRPLKSPVTVPIAKAVA
ncbi:MAG: hypothetical protein AAGG44_18140 [Planctomycetota bacterium]